MRREKYDWAAIEADLAAGMRLIDVAKKYGMPSNTIASWRTRQRKKDPPAGTERNAADPVPTSVVETSDRHDPLGEIEYGIQLAEKLRKLPTATQTRVREMIERMLSLAADT